MEEKEGVEKRLHNESDVNVNVDEEELLTSDAKETRPEAKEGPNDNKAPQQTGSRKDANKISPTNKNEKVDFIFRRVIVRCSAMFYVQFNKIHLEFHLDSKDISS